MENKQLNLNNFTATQQKILKLLADGECHRDTEVLALLPNDQATKSNLAPHLTVMRKQLRMIGQDIICRSRGRYVEYIHVRLLHDPQPVTSDRELKYS